MMMKSGLAFVLALTFMIVSASARADMAVVSEEVAYAPDGTKGYLARPEAPGKYPALILIHEWWGLNDNIRANARRFAAEGYVALAVDLYGGRSATKPEDARALATSVRKDMKGAFANLRHAIGYVKAQKAAEPKRIASVGWCFGGGWSYQIAKNNLGAKASVIYYGFFNPADDLAQMRAKIIGHFGETDRAIKVDKVKELQVKLKTQSGDHEVYIYPNSGHAFANEGGPRYNKQAADQAWTRTLAFLEKHL